MQENIENDKILKPGLIYLCKKAFENAKIQRDKHDPSEYVVMIDGNDFPIDYFPDKEGKHYSICIIDVVKSQKNGVLSQLIGEILDGFFGLVNDDEKYFLHLCINNLKLDISYEEMLKEGFDIKEVFQAIEKLAGKL